MSSKLKIALVPALGLLIGTSAMNAEEVDPLTVVKGFFAATNAGQADRAMALVGDDPVFVSTQGIEGRGRDAMQRFAQAPRSGKRQDRDHHGTG